MSTRQKKQITAVIIGAGHRSIGYASLALQYPEELKIVGVADPDEVRRLQVAQIFGLSPEQCYTTAEELATKPKIADAAINGTMDQQHLSTSLPLLKAGYDILLEKPMTTSKEDLYQLVKAARKFNRKIMVCHVLRYTPFYAAIRQRVLDGEIGDIINIQTVEHVSYHHMAACYVRGKWNSQARCGSSMLLAKCCHDMDVIAWMKSGVAVQMVNSFGGLFQFKPEKAPPGAGTRCLLDCKIEAECDYSARKHYLDISNPFRWSGYIWAGMEKYGVCLPEDEIEMLKSMHPEFNIDDHRHFPVPPRKLRFHSLKTDNPHGRCVWHCDNDVVDHQSVIVQFEDGSTATHNMVGGASRPMRSIHLIGTHGEIQGILEEGEFVIRHPDPRRGHEYSEIKVNTNESGDASGALGDHGGGDNLLMFDFLKNIRGETQSISCTCIEDSIAGHQMVFAADLSMDTKQVVSFSKDDLCQSSF